MKSDNIEESNPPIPPENTSVIIEFTDVFPNDNILIPLEVILVITEFVDVFSKIPLDK